MSELVDAWCVVRGDVLVDPILKGDRKGREWRVVSRSESTYLSESKGTSFPPSVEHPRGLFVPAPVRMVHLSLVDAKGSGHFQDRHLESTELVCVKFAWPVDVLNRSRNELLRMMDVLDH